jgi:hypothetical protein
MKILPYIIALIFSGVISVLLTFPIALIVGLFHAKMYNEKLGFWMGVWLAGIESFILVLFSIWVFSWFSFTLPIFFIIIITALVSLNNYNRYKTRPNKAKELGYLISQLFGIPCIYLNLINVSESVFIFW